MYSTIFSLNCFVLHIRESAVFFQNETLLTFARSKLHAGNKARNEDTRHLMVARLKGEEQGDGSKIVTGAASEANLDGEEQVQGSSLLGLATCAFPGTGCVAFNVDGAGRISLFRRAERQKDGHTGE